MRRLPVFYHDIDNFGDQLTPFILEKIYNKKVFIQYSSMYKRVMGVGSILHFSNNQTLIWGSGIIDPDKYNSKNISLDYKKILALRGEKTRDVLEQKLKITINCPLGDPALTIKSFYKPKIEKTFKIGLVPHYVDVPFVTAVTTKSLWFKNIKIIDVTQAPESVINDIVSCEYILSSSLHGLIIADVYGVSNIWVKFTDQLLGGDFKFYDYYSTTDLESPSAIIIDNMVTMQLAIERAPVCCQVNNYKYDPNILLSCLRNYKDF